MKKKLFISVGIFVLVICSVVGFSLKSNGNISTADEVNGADITKGMGAIPEKIVVYNKNDLKDDTKTVISGKNYAYQAGVSFPEKFDARDTFTIPEVENQSFLGTCWTFANTAACQESLIRSGNKTAEALSKWQLVFGTYDFGGDSLGLSREDSIQPKYGVDSCDQGGNSEGAINVMANHIGPVDESLVKYSDLLAKYKRNEVTGRYERIEDTDLDYSYIYDKTQYILTNAQCLSMSTPNRIKTKLMKYGLGAVSLYIDFSCFESSQMHSYYQNVSNSANHEVGIVGWDDNYAIENFKENNRPSKPGAWLLKNSWGTAVNDKGYFWVSYEDKSIMNSYAYFLDIADNSSGEYVYDEEYAYDGGLSNRGIEGLSSAANVFTMESAGTLQAASFTTLERGDDYSLTIYKNPENSDPTTGTKVGKTISGTIDERGYQLIDFTENGGEDIAYAVGDKLAIVLTLTNNDGEDGVYAIEGTMGDSDFVEVVGSDDGESFTKEDGTWTDIGAEGAGNLRIKAFGTRDESVKASSFTINQTTPVTLTKGESKQLDWTIEPATATDRYVSWSSANSKVAYVSGGEIFAKSEGTTIITGVCGGITKTVSVTVNEIHLTSITVPETITVKEEQMQEFNYQVYPENATDDIEVRGEGAVSILTDGDKQFVYGKSVTSSAIEIKYYVNGEVAKTTNVIVTPRSTPEEMTLNEMQSTHPYVNDYKASWSYSRPNTKGYYLTFDDKTMFENDYDFLYIYDKDKKEVGKYTGDSLAGQRIYVDSSAFTIYLDADPYENDYGFALTSIEAVPDKIVTPTPTPIVTPSPIITPTPTPTNTKRTLTLSATSPYLVVGKSRKIKCSESNVVFSVNKKKYCSISSKGVLKAKKAGAGKTVTVRAVSKDGSGSMGTFEMSLYAKSVKKITPKFKTFVVLPGKTVRLSSFYSISPKKGTCKKVRYQLTKNGYATISNNGFLTTKKEAKNKTLKIRVFALDGSKKNATLRIKVRSLL